jgi:ribosomal protein S18 acetylase RimI-like enzyme
VLRFFLSFFIVFPYFAFGFDHHISTTKNYETVFYEQITDSSLIEEENLFLNVFKETYQTFPLHQLGIDNFDCFLKNYFDLERTRLQEKKDEHYFFSAKINNQLVGIVSFSLTENQNEIYIHIVAVDQKYKNCSIGKELVFLCLKIVQNIQKILVDTRKLNSSSQAFYKALGFKECTAHYLDPNHYQGFEYCVALQN